MQLRKRLDNHFFNIPFQVQAIESLDWIERWKFMLDKIDMRVDAEMEIFCLGF